MRRTFAAAAMIGFMMVGGGRSAGAQKCGEPYEVAVNTPPEAIAKILVDQMFNDIVLTEAQQAKAVSIVKKTMADRSKLDSKAPDYREKLSALNTQRNTDLMALLSKESDKAKLTACFKKMEGPPRGGGLGVL